MLEVIREKLRPLFLRKFNVSKRGAHRAALEAGMTPKERRLFMSGFAEGWMRGAVDATAVKASDLHPPAPPPEEDSSEVH
jgi:hypothetical protein